MNIAVFHESVLGFMSLCCVFCFSLCATCEADHLFHYVVLRVPSRFVSTTPFFVFVKRLNTRDVAERPLARTFSAWTCMVCFDIQEGAAVGSLWKTDPRTANTDGDEAQLTWFLCFGSFLLASRFVVGTRERGHEGQREIAVGRWL